MKDINRVTIRRNVFQFRCRKGLQVVEAVSRSFRWKFWIDSQVRKYRESREKEEKVSTPPGVLMVTLCKVTEESAGVKSFESTEHSVVPGIKSEMPKS